MTPQGKRVIDEAVVEVTQLERRLAAYLDEDDCEALTAMIRRFQRNLDAPTLGPR